jgi:hypothetical protein
MKSVLLTYLFLLIGVASLQAQTAPVDTTNRKPYYILLKDGSYIFGRIVRRDSTMLAVQMRSGQLTYVERELYQALSGSAPIARDSTTYYTNMPLPAQAQPASATTAPGTYLITLADGTILRGQVISQDTSRVVVKTEKLGTVYVPVSQVVKLETERAVRSRRIGDPHPPEGYTNLFPQYLNFTPTAFQAERGKLYYRNSMLYVNQFDAGLTDFWSVGVAFLPLGNILAGWVTTKLSVPLGPQARIGVQGQYFFGTIDFARQNFTANYLQGILSFGDTQRNVTIGVGFNPGGSAQILTLGFVRKQSRLLSFISENQLVLSNPSGTFAKLGAGARLDRRRHSFDLSLHVLIYPQGSYLGGGISTGALPWASYQVRIGK